MESARLTIVDGSVHGEADDRAAECSIAHASHRGSAARESDRHRRRRRRRKEGARSRGCFCNFSRRFGWRERRGKKAVCAVQLCETHNVYRCCMGEYIHLCTFVRRLHACIFLVLFYTVRLSNCLCKLYLYPYSCTRAGSAGQFQTTGRKLRFGGCSGGFRTFWRLESRGISSF